MEGGARSTPRLSPAQIRKRASQVDILLSEAHKDDLLGAPYNENALYGGAGTDRQPLYHLVVMTTGGGGLDVATAPDGQDLVYSFRPNPQEIDFTEPAAAEIQALQGGGRYVEHQGDAIGDLTIGGTTGVFLPDLPAPGSPFDRHRSRALFGSGVGELDSGIKSASGPGADISPGLGRAWEFQENQDSDFQAGANKLLSSCREALVDANLDADTRVYDGRRDHRSRSSRTSSSAEGAPGGGVHRGSRAKYARDSCCSRVSLGDELETSTITSARPGGTSSGNVITWFSGTSTTNLMAPCMVPSVYQLRGRTPAAEGRS